MNQTDPYVLFKLWYDEEATKQDAINLNSVGLATVNEFNKPQLRIVLYKGLSRGGFRFFTNYDSDKGKQIAANPHVAMTFHWRDSERQIRINGTVTKTERSESQEYWDSRPRNSQISAYTSLQSQPIESFSHLKEQVKANEEKFANEPIPCPQNWGGYILQPNSFEFWQGEAGRLHQRTRFISENDKWIKTLLAP